MAGRAEELGVLNDAHKAAAGAMYLLTLTLPHDEGDDLKPLRKHISRAWSRMTQGAPFKRWKERLELAGTVRALEVTHGRNGWHPHLHVALYSRGLTAGELEEFREWCARQWRRFVTEKTANGRTYRAPSAAHGVTLQALNGSSYLTKMGLAGELTLAASKEGRGEHRTPWQILRDLTVAAYTKGKTTDDTLEDRSLWWEYSRAMKGARQLTYSKGLRQKYALPAELEDAALADTQTELEPLAPGESEEVATWNAEEWARICRLGVAARLALLQVPRLPREAWPDAIQRILDESMGLPLVPF